MWQRYGAWLLRLGRLDLGTSLIYERPVRELIGEAVPSTLSVCALALALAYALALPLGAWLASSRQHGSVRIVSPLLFAAYALPSFWLALVGLELFALGEPFDWLPLGGAASDDAASLGPIGRTLDHLWHLILPVSCLALPLLARTSKHVESAVKEALAEPYVRTARAKGLPRALVLRRHVAPRALVPILALLSMDLPYVVGGSVVIERIFRLPGMGMLAVDALLRRDIPVLLGVLVVSAALTLTAVLVVDLAQAWLDPRLREELGASWRSARIASSSLP